jgi:hypothetical protein
MALIISWQTRPPKNAQSGGMYPLQVSANLRANTSVFASMLYG